MSSRQRMWSERPQRAKRRKEGRERGKAGKAPGVELSPARSAPGDPEALLGSPQMAGPASAPLRAQAVKELEQRQGNRYVQRVLERIRAEKGTGGPLEPRVRAEMEAAFGRDLGAVRVHRDEAADGLAGDLGARAFTAGQDIFIRSGEPSPRSSEGRRLLAHELAHVLQQRGGSPAQASFSRPGDPAEREAEALGQAMASSPVPQLRGSLPVQRMVPWGQVQGGWLREIWEQIRVTFGGETVVEEHARQLEQNLDRAQTLIQAAEAIATDPDTRRRLERCRGAMEQVSGPLGRYLDIREKIGRVVRFADAVRELNEVDVSQEPERAARAFGRLFSATGELGEDLPAGPWTGYFTLLSNMGDFFVNMRSLIVPEERPSWQRLHEELEREAPGAGFP